ncbi:MAG: DUF973 family protein [Ignisphaera sp.]
MDFFTSHSQSINQRYVESFSSMRTGILLLLIGSLMISIAFIGFLISILIPGLSLYRTPVITDEILLLLGILGVLSITGSIISIIGLFSKLMPGVSKLAEIDSRFSTASTLIKIGYITGFILLIIGFALLIVIIGIFIILIGAIFVLIGEIGFIVLCFNLNDAERDSLYLTAGILFILGLFIFILSIIGWILLYMALGHSIDKRSKQPSSFLYTPTPPPPI